VTVPPLSCVKPSKRGCGLCGNEEDLVVSFVALGVAMAGSIKGWSVADPFDFVPQSSTWRMR
jgi:hypothetical protein